MQLYNHDRNTVFSSQNWITGVRYLSWPTIQFLNISITSKSSLLLFTVNPFSCPRPPLICSVSVGLPFLEISRKGSHTVCCLLWLASFT